jgi:hypothetical protein
MMLAGIRQHYGMVFRGLPDHLPPVGELQTTLGDRWAGGLVGW